jgi:hypothetical protein
MYTFRVSESGNRVTGKTVKFERGKMTKIGYDCGIVCHHGTLYFSPHNILAINTL